MVVDEAVVVVEVNTLTDITRSLYSTRQLHGPQLSSIDLRVDCPQLSIIEQVESE
jgi:hypothetical protein